MKKLIIIALLFCASSAMAQDTIHVEKVLVVNQVINRKTGKIMHRWFRKMKVKSGYIIKEESGLFIINGKEMAPDNFSYSDIIVKK